MHNQREEKQHDRAETDTHRSGTTSIEGDDRVGQEN